jgi:polysaccharide export outer membrane protein
MITFYRNAFLLLLCLSLFACSSYKKGIYFADVNRQISTKETISNYTPITVQTEDILGISISSLNPESSAIFNFASNSASGSSESSNGYLVDEKGNVQLPILGTVHVGNLTTSQVREQIRLQLTPYLKEPVVVVKLINFKISVMGDVANPGLFKVQSERLTIPEAISLAGDLSVTALRSLLIIREVNGEREFINVDLTSKKLFSSPYYYLKNNDVIYVQAGKIKYSSIDPFYQRVSLLLSLVSVAAIFIFR